MHLEMPSGRNFLEKSNSRPRITSLSISQRTFFDISMHLATPTLLIEVRCVVSCQARQRYVYVASAFP